MEAQVGDEKGMGKFSSSGVVRAERSGDGVKGGGEECNKAKYFQRGLDAVVKL